MANQDSDIGTKNAELLKRIRQRYAYAMDKWRRNREEGQKNIRYVSGDPWDDADKAARKNRPTVCPDELNQYVNQVVNTARQNPRGVKIDPAGDNASEQLAEYRENRIRAIEYACNAAQVYVNGLQAAVERNIGWWKVSRVYISDQSDEQEIVILPVMNPDSILADPDYKELDGSDMKWCFELDKMTVEEFEREFPDAERRSFSTEDFGGDDNHGWFDGKNIVIASYYEVVTEKRKAGKGSREVVARSGVQQYITNGVDILKKGAKQPGPYIPLVPVFGKELWVDFGGGAERVLLSLVSLARDAQKALAYVMSSMLENIGQLPKTSFVGWVGQFETDAEAWATLNNEFHNYLQLDPGTALDSTGNPLPPLGWAKSTPDFAAYSIGTDICRRAIMSAMGLQALPTSAQRQNQKSGVALDKIESQQSIGSYHLVDSYERAIRLTGRIVNCWLSQIDLGEVKRPVRMADGKHQLVSINTDQAVMEGEHEYHFPIADDQGRYQVTISTGPSDASQREAGSDFATSLLQSLDKLPPPGSPAAQVLSLVIRLKQLGPLGDQMADIFSPQQNGAQQQMAQMGQQMQQMQTQFGQMQQDLQKLQLEKAGKVIEGQFRMEQAKMQSATQIAVAEISASKDANEGIAERENDTYQLWHEQSHDIAMQKDQQAHDAQMTQVQHAQAMQQAEQGAQHQAALSDQSAVNQSAQSAQDAAQSQAAQPDDSQAG